MKSEPLEHGCSQTGLPHPISHAGLPLEWRVHTSLLLEEIAARSSQPALRMPLRILGQLLSQVGERAAVLNDPVLNALMVRLTIYTIADPDSPDYDPVQVAEVLREGVVTP